MAAIDTEEKAERLARAIVSDIKLYNDAKIAAGANIADEVAEGRRLFVDRVAPGLQPIFEAALSASPLAMYALGSGMEHPPREPARYEHPPVEPPLRAEPVGGSSSGVLVAVALAVLALGLAAAAFFALAH